jgi:hypothetical protein
MPYGRFGDQAASTEEPRIRQRSQAARDQAGQLLFYCSDVLALVIKSATGRPVGRVLC